MIALRLESLDIHGMATQMAKSLAAMHWAARTDARDVEYILGSAAEKQRISQLEVMQPETRTSPRSGQLDDSFSQKD